jgi:hypothetical protein
MRCPSASFHACVWIRRNDLNYCGLNVLASAQILERCSVELSENVFFLLPHFSHSSSATLLRPLLRALDVVCAYKARKRRASIAYRSHRSSCSISSSLICTSASTYNTSATLVCKTLPVLLFSSSSFSACYISSTAFSTPLRSPAFSSTWLLASFRVSSSSKVSSFTSGSFFYSPRFFRFYLTCTTSGATRSEGEASVSSL